MPRLLCLLATLVTAGLAGQAAPRPHIVFLLIDDLGYADAGFNGGKDIRTPHIDALARGGTILGAHYAQPVCSPTRAALLTGRYPTRTGVYSVVRPRTKWGLPLAERTLANALKDAGYQTALTGKWHLGESAPAYLPTARGFDHQYGHYFGMIDFFTHQRGADRDWYRNDQPLQEQGYSTELIADEACRVIAGRDPAKPLFLYVPFNGVHSPLQVPDHYLQPYAHLQGNRRIMAGMLAAVDHAIGRIVATLEQSGLRENTLIIFASDNGGPLQYSNDNGPLRDGKGTLYEGGVRVCAFAHWPGRIPAGAKVDEPTHMIDWYPTLVRLGGGSLVQQLPLDGQDIWPVLTAGAKSPHEAILLARSPEHAALRLGDWKLLLPRPASKAREARRTEVELYNLAVDPGEATNLAAREPARVALLRSRLEAYLRDAVPEGDGAASGAARDGN